LYSFSCGGATDAYGERAVLFPDVKDIFNDIQQCGIKMAAASRCSGIVVIAEYPHYCTHKH